VLDATSQKTWWQVLIQALPPALLAPQDWDETEIEMVEEHENFPTFGNMLDQHISELEELLTALAERGVKTLTELHIKSFADKVMIFQTFGLSTLARTLQQFIAASEHYPRYLFSTNYLTLLHRQAANSRLSV
jgi:hypothetical protein